MRLIVLKIIFAFVLFSNLPLALHAQTVLDDLNKDKAQISKNMPEEENLESQSLPEETIEKISRSGNIFIISNDNNSFAEGDFITLIRKNKKINRAISAKVIDGKAGIRIKQLYDEKAHYRLRPTMKVRILKGDDSQFGKAESKKNEKLTAKIKSEDDLFNDKTVLEEDLLLEENTNRVIKTDNLIFVSYSFVEGLDNSGNSKRYGQVTGSWGYQVADNIWAEAAYGQSVITDYPTTENTAGGLDTTFKNITIKLKYTVRAPLYSFIQPYVGYQILDASSPNAGQEDSSKKLSSSELQEEVQKVDNLKKKSVIFGITVLRRLVPGWFLRGDFGSDVLSFGLGLEF